MRETLRSLVASKVSSNFTIWVERKWKIVKKFLKSTSRKYEDNLAFLLLLLTKISRAVGSFFYLLNVSCLFYCVDSFKA